MGRGNMLALVLYVKRATRGIRNQLNGVRVCLCVCVWKLYRHLQINICVYTRNFK